MGAAYACGSKPPGKPDPQGDGNERYDGNGYGETCLGLGTRSGESSDVCRDSCVLHGNTPFASSHELTK